MAFLVYILVNDSRNRTYIGQTCDIARRLNEHNRGYVRSTKPYRPWQLLLTESFTSRREAMVHERWLKSPRGRKKVKALLAGISRSS